MFRFSRLWFEALARVFCTQPRLVLENLALPQQLAALKRKHPRPRLGLLDKLFWVIARRFWADWKSVLIIVTPDTVARWHELDPHLLEFHFQCGEASWQETTSETNAGAHIANGQGEPELGCSPHSW